MAAPTMRRRAKTFLLDLGVYGVFWKTRGWLRGVKPSTLIANRRWRRAHPDADPVPPPRLIYDVINVYEIEAFIDTGRRSAEKIERSLAQAGYSISDFESILDFGCGCGRIIRHWPHKTTARLAGSDYNTDLIAWCQHNLGFAEFLTNQLEPPLDRPDASFDLVYANSVFTHLDEALEHAWLKELRRVLTGDGVLLLTTHGEAWKSGLDDDESKRYERGEIVVRSAASSGSNLCETYHSPSYFRPVAERYFKTVFHFPQGSQSMREQDVWVLSG